MPLYPPPSSGGGSPGGSDTELQYNNSSTFGGVPVANYDGSVLFLDAPVISHNASSGMRILPDETGFNDASLFYLKSTESNTRANCAIVPNGSVVNYPAILSFFSTDFLADATNYEEMAFLSKGSGDTYHAIVSLKGGTGTLRPINIEAKNTVGATAQLVIGTDGGVSVGTGTAAGSTNLKVAGTITGSNLSGTNTGDQTISIATTSPVTGGPITGTGTIALDATVDFAFLTPQHITANDAFASVPQDLLILAHNTTGVAANGLGVAIQFLGESSTTINREQGEIDTDWTDVTDASRTARMSFRVVNNALIGRQMTLFGSGGMSVNNTTDPGAGYVNTTVGYKINNVALAASNVGAVPTTRALTIGPTTADLSADRSFITNVTNDAQTKAAVVPNTAPSSGQVLAGNAGRTAYAPVTLSGSGATASLSSAGVLTLSAIANATLSNSAITINGTSVSLGGSLVGTIQSPAASVSIPDGYSLDIARRYKITGTNNLTIAGNGVFMVH